MVKSLTLHCCARSRIGSRLFGEIHRFVHPELNLPLVIQQTRDRTFKETFKLVRVTQIATVQKQNGGQTIVVTIKKECRQKRSKINMYLS